MSNVNTRSRISKSVSKTKERNSTEEKNFVESNFRFCKPLHMSELNTARDIIEIQYNGHMGFARLSTAFRATIGNDVLPVNFFFSLCKMKFFMIQ